MSTYTGGATKAAVTEILKRVYEGGLEDQRNNKLTWYGRTPKKKVGRTESRFFNLRFGRMTSHGYQAETGDLPNATTQSQKQGEYNPKEWYGTVRFTYRVMQLVKTNPGAFMDRLKDDMNGLEQDALDYHEIIVAGDGTGTLGTIKASGITGAVVELVDPEDARKFHSGMILNAWEDRTGSAGSPTTQMLFNGASATGEVASVDTQAGTVTLTADPTLGGGTLSDNDVLVKVGSRTDRTRHEFMGIYGIADDGDPDLDDSSIGTAAGLHGIDVATYPWWKAKVFGNSGTPRDLTTRLLQDAQDAMMINSGRHPDEYWVPYSVRMEFGEQMQTQRRTVNEYRIGGSTQPGHQNDDGGDYLTFQGIPFIPGKYARANTLVAINNAKWCLKESVPFHWVRDDGAILHRSSDGKPAFVAQMAKFCESKCTQRNAFVRIDDLTGTEVV